VLTPSKLVLESKGVPSIAEASALVVAGRSARLLGTRVATAQATCAIAIGDGRWRCISSAPVPARPT
jgi:cobalt-precorrin 5A hydrolase